MAARRAALRIACLVDDDIAAELRRSAATSTRARYDLSVVLALRRLYRDVELVTACAGSVRTFDALDRLKPDVVFNLAYSAHPLEASFAGGLDVLGFPYTGSAPRGIALSRDKVRSRHLLRAASVPVPRFVELLPRERIQVDLAPPLIVKPVSLAGSAGIYDDSVTTNVRDVPRLAKRIWQRFGVAAMCEEFIVGRELRIGLVEDAHEVFRRTGITEWRFGTAAPGWGFKTEAVRTDRRVRLLRRVTRDIIDLPRRELLELTAIVRTATRALDVRGYATVDLRVDERGRMSVLEVNANPGLWSGSPIWSTPAFDANIRRIVAAALR
ncbi:MAG TPA: hypothetical protein VN224_00800 [Xanthomonadales bacterium]|nr:hypothetical protein [Xanthomonadales bacterium]